MQGQETDEFSVQSANESLVHERIYDVHNTRHPPRTQRALSLPAIDIQADKPWLKSTRTYNKKTFVL